MGGTPRSPKKPRPSYETGDLRDAEIAEAMESDYKKSDLAALITKAAQVAKKSTTGLNS